MKKVCKDLQGIIVPMVTPLKDGMTLDLQGVERLIDHLISGGVHGLFILGTTGEAPGLGMTLRFKLIEKVCGYTDGRIPVLVGLLVSSFEESIALAEKAENLGARGLVLAPPYYYPVDQEEIIRYVTKLAENTSLPIILYNIPSLTKFFFEINTVIKLAQLENVIGLKDSSGDMLYYNYLIQEFNENEDFLLWIGPEELLAESVLLGGNGGIPGGGNFYPQLYTKIYEAASMKDLEKVRQFQKVTIQISSTIYKVGNHSLQVIKGIKCALAIKGICNDCMAEPYHQFRQEERDQVRIYLQDLDLLP